MEYEKIINLLDNTQNESSKFRTRNRVEKIINHEERIMSVSKIDLNLQ